MTDNELRDLIASIAVLQEKTAKHMDETAKYMEDAEQRRKEAVQRRKEADEEMQALRESQQETARQIKETDRQLRFQLKELGQQIGGLGNKFGRFTEGQAFPAMKKILQQRFNMEVISQRVTSPVIGHEQEIDVLAYANGQRNEVFVVEVKSLLRERELKQVLTLLEKFPQAFPEHANKHLYCIVAVVDAPKEMQQRVLDEGLYLAVINDEQFDLAIPDNFHPKEFNAIVAA